MRYSLQPASTVKLFYHAEMQSSHLQTREIDVVDDSGPKITDKITGRIAGLLDHDKALDELFERQQQRKGDVTFSSP